VWIDDATRNVRYRLDSYSPGEFVVSRRWTQLGEITEVSGRRCLDEIVTKYNPLAQPLRISGTPGNVSQLGAGGVGGGLMGRPIFEVPVQNSPIPSTVLERAAHLNIVIRDPTGTIYRINP
jgi:hypothetical protein